jgi:Golgi phosphoprotein 3 (GPP34)
LSTHNELHTGIAVPATDVTLTLPEELLLLRVSVGDAMSRPTGEFLSTAKRPLAAARLIDLILAKRIAVTFRRRHLLSSDSVAVLDATPTGDALLDDVLQLIATPEPHSCRYWVKHTARGVEVAYWDRLVEKALLRPEHVSFDAPWDGVHAGTLSAIAERVRSAITEPGRADLRDVALATLVVHTQSLFMVLHRLQRSPAGLARSYMAHRRDEGLATDALDSYKRSLTSHAGLAEADRKWAETAADGIARLVTIVETRPQRGGG